jgi:CotH kinase protein/Chitobiase/beta-hexosaminidase C-terminal domain/Lamin Tail Domain
MVKSFRIFLCFLFVLNGFSAFSQVKINEYCAANYDNNLDNLGNYSDWIELYNPGGAAANIGGYFLSDNINQLGKWEIPAISIPAGGHTMFWASDKDITTGSDLHTNFKLTQVKLETIYFSDASLTIIDSIKIIPCQKNHSRGRVTDGAATWGVFVNPTPNTTNATAYNSYALRPVFSLPSGFYTVAAQFNITTSQAGITIRYTTDGTEPTATSTVASGPVYVSSTTVIRAKAFSSSGSILPSFTETNTYFLNATHNIAVISMCGDFDGLFNGFGGQINNTFEYFDIHGDLGHEGDGDTRGHGNDSWAYDQKGMRFYTRDDYGYANNIEEQLFQASAKDEFDVVILKAGASDNYPGGTQQSGLLTCHLRDAYCQTLSQKHNLNLDERSYEPVAMYLNGQYWGLYEVRERIDADYADYYYDQHPDSVDMLAYWGGLTVEEGSTTDWDALYTYMTTNDLAIPANYDYVDDRLDVMSLIDYIILNTFVVNTDWLNWNTAWWRGFSNPGVKWRYRLWDQDNIFNLGQNYTGVGTTTFNNDPCNPTELFSGDPNVPHNDMLNALDANPTFHALYINRYADLLNTVFDCDTMLAHLDWLVNRIEPEMNQHVVRWGGTIGEWHDHLDSIRVQISGRCSVVDSLMNGCYDLTGPFDVTVIVDPPGAGGVRVNTLMPTAYPWTGSYFGNIQLSFYENATAGFDLINWTVNNHTPTISATSDTMSLTLSQGDTVIAHYSNVAIDPGAAAGFAFKAFPVPSSDVLHLSYSLGKSTSFTLSLYSLEGTRVAELKRSPEGGMPAGSYSEPVNLAALGVPAGIYFVQFESADVVTTKKIVYLPR